MKGYKTDNNDKTNNKTERMSGIVYLIGFYIADVQNMVIISRISIILQTQ